ncbi:uncharacterized protein M6B38_418615 [Iris pallida]|uniref:DUF7950 domain-containing protein n=1 Tax=Iris pallida TaxID=29817 RepID=A0AAX6FHQ9_IRIPA|nr:uncharacterized protein M6B38_418615 [Iris pallida]
MLQSVDAAKTHEIMARFRPIAPKPHLPPSSRQPLHSPPAALLRARPRRARKRGRPDPLLPAPSKRPKPLLLPVPPPPPVERDLLKNLQEPPPRPIAPVPLRPVGSSISVACISPLAGPPPPVPTRPEEVESEAEPAVVSDWSNRVRLANSAYKEMVGQPECPWLETTAPAAASRRIGGEVALDLPAEPWGIPAGAGGFSCRVRVAWARDGRRSFVDAPCDVSRLRCGSNDYKFAWRIRTAAGFGNNCVWGPN